MEISVLPDSVFMERLNHHCQRVTEVVFHLAYRGIETRLTPLQMAQSNPGHLWQQICHPSKREEEVI